MAQNVAFVVALVSLPFVFESRPSISSSTNQILFFEDANGPNTATVRVVVADLEFQFVAHIDDHYKTIDPGDFRLPNPYRLSERSDIVPLLEADLKNATGHRQAIVYMLSTVMLPYIDHPKAADLFVRLPEFYKEGNWVCMLFLDAKPEDATSPPAWLRHTGDKAVLASILKAIDREDGAGAGRTTYSLNLLATTNATAAQHRLRGWFEKHKEHWASGVANTISCGLYPMTSKHWKYLVSEILPHLAHDHSMNENRYESLSVWGKFCTCEADRFIDGFSWDQIRPLAEVYLSNLFADPQFDKIISGWTDPTTKIEEKDLLWRYDNYENLLTISTCFGTRDQIKSFEQALAHYEGLLSRKETPAMWPLGRGGATSGPAYDDAIASFRELKKAALVAMETRASNLPR